MNNADKLFNLAKHCQNSAYAPYSGFFVGAAILSSNDNFYSGCNVENVSYPEGICAETGAIAQMIANNDRLIKEIIIMAESENLIFPCGGCLQRIKEFSDNKTLIHLADHSGIQKTFKINELLPHAFSTAE